MASNPGATPSRSEIPAAPGHHTVGSFLGAPAPPGVQYEVDVANNPGVNVNNLAAGKPATGSGSFWTQQPYLAVDGNPFTYWNSGNFPPQWIEVDLGAPVTIAEVALSITQLPNGYTVHRVYGKLSATDPYTLLHVFSGPTVDIQTLRARLDSPFTARCVRIQTTASPSWVGWREIGVYPAPIPTATW
jgi:F5/8 type C domain-containing protein